MKKWMIAGFVMLLLTVPTLATNIAPEATAMGSAHYGDDNSYLQAFLVDQKFNWDPGEAYMSVENGNWFALSWNENKTFDEIRLYNIGYANPAFASLNLYDFDLRINTNTSSTNINDAVWQTVDEVRGGAPNLYTYTSESPITSNAILVYVITQSSSPTEPYLRVIEMEVESATVPEPVTMGLLAVAGVGLLLRKRQK